MAKNGTAPRRSRRWRGSWGGEPELLRQALAAAAAIGDEEDRAKALAAVARQLAGEPEIWQRVLREAERLGDLEKRVSVLNALASSWNPSFGYSHLAQILDAMDVSPRKDWLAPIQSLLPAIIALGGKATVRQTADAIADTARWWP